jgi:hypothetical protein
MHTRRLILSALAVGLVAVAVVCWLYYPREGTSPTAAETKPSTVEPPAAPLFEDVTAASGVVFTYQNGENLVDAQGQPVKDEQGKQRQHLAILESLGGGVALIDYDGDGLRDLFLIGGGYYADAPDYHTIKGHPCKLYKNLGKLRFEDVSSDAGLNKLAGGEDWFYSHGTTVGDYDRDGWPDLLVTGWARVALLHNVAGANGGRRFEDVTAAAGLSRGIEWATSAALADLDGDGYPDLYVCQYADWSWDKHPACSYDGKIADVCPPKNFNGLRHKLYRNTGEGAFVDVSDTAGLRPGGTAEGKGLGVLVVDLDGDSRPDIYVANDTVDNFLYVNRSQPGQILLEEKGLLSGAARDDRGSANGSMGLDAGDPERTGKPALWVTNYQNELHALYRNEGKPGQPMFHFRTAGAGIAAIGQTYVGWGTAFLDADLDGWEDLFVSNGHAIRFPAGKEANRKQRPILLLNKAGKFREASRQLGEYFDTPRQGRGVGAGDLDNDGRIELVLNHLNEPTSLLRGIGGPENRWIGVELVGKDHACVVGARAVLEVDGQKLTRFAKAGGSYASSGDRRLVYGLGNSEPGQLTVYWPDGSEQAVDGLVAGQYCRVEQE